MALSTLRQFKLRKGRHEKIDKVCQTQNPWFTLRDGGHDATKDQLIYATIQKLGLIETNRDHFLIIKKNSPITSRRLLRAAAQACGPQDISFQNCSILDRNSPRVDGSLELFKASETRMKETILWFIWIPSGCDSVGSVDQRTFVVS